MQKLKKVEMNYIKKKKFVLEVFFLKILKRILLSIAVLAVFLQLSALIKCEIITHKHIHEFTNFQVLGQSYDYKHKKILNYYGRYPTTANIYCWSPDSLGSVMSFVFNRDTEKWEQISEDTIWSVSGSASEVIWPYWWHFIYGGL